ncbi:MAG TPA: hypothetical protein VHH33_02475 [Nitrososphaeraceae archaeon]|jgi:hypothetical protein|nr:hypothetical protein [Nitrososphaeraceae archaeon]
MVNKRKILSSVWFDFLKMLNRESHTNFKHTSADELNGVKKIRGK